MTTDPSAMDRDTRRAQLRALAARHFPTAAECRLAAALLAVEFEDGDQARGQLAVAVAEADEAWGQHRRSEERREQAALRLRKARAQRDEARADRDRLREQLAESETNGHRLLQRAEAAEAEVKKWLAFIERGMDTHMSFGVINPDGTTEQLPCADWCHACRVERAEAELATARRQLAAAKTARSASDVLVQHDVTRKALCDALGVGYHLNWQQLVDAAQQAEHLAEQRLTERRQAIADALGCPPATPWRDLIETARAAHGDRARAIDALTAAERRAEDAEGGRVAADNVLRAVCAALGVGPDHDPVVEARETLARAERAEAALGRVRAVLQPRNEDDVTDWQRGHRACSIVALDALDHKTPGSEPERCCVCGGPDTPYENYRGQLFCWPCADCACNQVPCVRTGTNDPAAPAEAALAPYTAPVSPRELQVVYDDHPIHALRTALTGPGVTDYRAGELIGDYYRAITSAPPADPAEQPQPLVINLDLTDRDMVKAIRKALRNSERR